MQCSKDVFATKRLEDHIFKYSSANIAMIFEKENITHVNGNVEFNTIDAPSNIVAKVTSNQNGHQRRRCPMQMQEKKIEQNVIQ